MRSAIRSVAALVLVATSVTAARSDEPKVIKVAEARNHVGAVCAVTFKVRHTKYGVNRKTYFLDSEEDFKSDKNLGVQISEAVAMTLKEKKSITDPHVYYADKTIRVVGKIFLQEDRPYLTIEKPDDIDVMDDSAKN